MHMPTHIGDTHNEGGNRMQVRFLDKGTNIHTHWDSGTIQRAGKTEEFWLTELAALDTPDNRAATMKSTVEDRATDSLLAAQVAYSVPELRAASD
jgi:hypothetical protein